MPRTKFKGRKAGKPFEKKDKEEEVTLSTLVKDKGFKSYKGKGVPVFKKGPNDPSWRTGNALSTALAANLPFGYANGLQHEIGSISSSQPIVYRTPGIMRIALLVTAGQAVDYNSPINLAARKVFSNVRKANAGRTNYDAVDMMLVFLAYEQALACLGWLQRLYRTINKFSALDRYQPKFLVTAMQVNYDDIKKNQAELAWLIRWMGSAINSVAIPRMPIFTAAYDAFRHIYTDDSSPRKQIYLFDAFNFGTYNPTYNANGGAVDFDGGSDKCASFGAVNTPLTYSEIYGMVHSIMDPLMGDQDVGIILGDIMKAYDESELFKADSDIMDTIELEHSEEILQQIHNLRVLPSGYAFLSAYSQLPGSTGTAPYLISDITVATASAATGYPLKYHIDAFSDTPTPQEIVNCTALQCRIKWHRSTTNPATNLFDECSFDLYLPVKVEYYVDIYNPTSYLSEDLHYSDIMQHSISSLTRGLFWGLNFDWCPLAMLQEETTATRVTDLLIGDTRMLNFFDFDVHKRIHENSVLCLFDLLNN